MLQARIPCCPADGKGVKRTQHVPGTVCGPSAAPRPREPDVQLRTQNIHVEKVKEQRTDVKLSRAIEAPGESVVCSSAVARGHCAEHARSGPGVWVGEGKGEPSVPAGPVATDSSSTGVTWPMLENELIWTCGGKERASNVDTTMAGVAKKCGPPNGRYLATLGACGCWFRHVPGCACRRPLGSCA